MIQNLSIPAYTPNIHKKKRVFRQAKGYFMHIICADCEQRTVAYSHSQTNVKCKGCSALLVRSTGGTAEIVGKTKSKKAENVY